jgi:hypothetical protein
MRKTILVALMSVATTPAICAPPSALRAALEQWASPRPITRYQFALVDLNGDGILDAVVQVTDPAFCGNGGCPIVEFKGESAGFTLVGSSGLVRKPICLLNEMQDGWHTLAAVVGFADGAGVVPIRFKQQQGAYRSTPYVNAQIKLTSQAVKQLLDFEEAP